MSTGHYQQVRVSDQNWIFLNKFTVGGPLFCNFRTRKSYKIRGTLQNKGPVPLILYKIRGTYYAFRIVNMKTASFRIKRVRKSITRFFVVFQFSQKSEKYFEKKNFQISEKVSQKKFIFVLKNTFKSSQDKKPKKNGFQGKSAYSFFPSHRSAFFSMIF